MVNRRQFIKNSSLGLAGLSLARIPLYAASTLPGVPLNWLEQPGTHQGVTWGTPWPKGYLKGEKMFKVKGDRGEAAVQTWPLAFWPDGSLKWTGHALPGNVHIGENPVLEEGNSTARAEEVKLTEKQETITVETGALTAVLNRRGRYLIESLAKEGKTICSKGKLVALINDQPDHEPGRNVSTDSYESELQKVTVEQKGPVRATVKLEGIHRNQAGRDILPFVVRLYFYAGSADVKIIHTFIFDGDENRDFIRGLGLKFEVDFQGEELHNRHIRFAGQDRGVFGEAVRGLTGLRRDPGKAARDAQVAGKRTPDAATFPPAVSERTQYIAAFGDYTLYQSTADAFEIQKRTKPGHGWLQAGYGKRSAGTGYVGSPAGGLAFGLRNFWESYPAQLDISNAIADQAEVAVWLWAPRSSPMDLRFYHDGMGQDTFEKQLQGLEINYEDYEPGFGTPMGVARTSEICLKVLGSTPSHAELADFATQVQQPAVLTPTSRYLREAGAFGGAFTVLEAEVEKQTEVEKQLDFYFNFYRDQVEQHHWYGFWNYGDVMHTYDADRQVWRYDVGGFAWDNSELSTDIWLWTYFLSTGRADVFRMAEAMTRHTGEVDVHHTGRFSPLGSRHNVLHWGCSAKQLRISTAANRRYYYYLTADERTGDLMREQIEAVRTLQSVVPIRKVNPDVPKNTENSDVASVGFGTDWGAIAAAWLTEWERTGSEEMKTRLLNSMRTIAAQPRGFFTGLSMMNISTGEFEIDTSGKVSVSHLSAVFGLPEICFELIELGNDPAFEKAWLEYCRLYNAPPEEQEARLGERLRRLNLQQGHARLTAYAAWKTGDAKLAERAWQEFYKGEGGIGETSRDLIRHTPPEVLHVIDEGPGISTNAVAQWGLAVMQCLAFARKQL